MDQISKTLNSLIAFLIVGIILVVMSGSEIYGRASVEVNGKIVNKEVVCQQPNNNRCVANYLISSDLGKNQSIYSAGPTDQSLLRDLPVGTVLKKKKWELVYEVDGKTIDDFPITFYVGLIAIGLFAIGVWIYKRNSQ